MSARTFYLAAASTNAALAHERIADLERMGMTCAYDWTALDQPESAWPTVSQEEIDAVLGADVFVACSPITPGVAFELGVRVTGDLLAGQGTAHLVGEWRCPFARGSRVIHHATWDAFLAWRKTWDAFLAWLKT